MFRVPYTIQPLRLLFFLESPRPFPLYLVLLHVKALAVTQINKALSQKCNACFPRVHTGHADARVNFRILS